MTREKAREVLKDWDGYFIGHSSDDVNEALNMAIKALEQEPTTKNDLGVNTNKLLADCEKMSFDIEIFNKPLKVVALDAVKNIAKDLINSENPNKSEILTGSTTKNDLAVEKIVDVLGSYTDLDIPYKHKIAEDILNNLPSVTPQEPILDKIRAEIEQDAFKDVNGSKFIFVNRVNQIIDKYKAESEPQESEINNG